VPLCLAPNFHAHPHTRSCSRQRRRVGGPDGNQGCGRSDAPLGARCHAFKAYHRTHLPRGGFDGLPSLQVRCHRRVGLMLNVFGTDCGPQSQRQTDCAPAGRPGQHHKLKRIGGPHWFTPPSPPPLLSRFIPKHELAPCTHWRQQNMGPPKTQTNGHRTSVGHSGL
jgi:hypothetical protein